MLTSVNYVLIMQGSTQLIFANVQWTGVVMTAPPMLVIVIQSAVLQLDVMVYIRQIEFSVIRIQSEMPIITVYVDKVGQELIEVYLMELVVRPAQPVLAQNAQIV